MPCEHQKREKGLVAPFPVVTTVGSELHRKVQEDLAAERVIRARERVAVAVDRRIFVEQVEDASAQREGLADGPHAGQVEVVTRRELRVRRRRSSAEERIAA